jgi:hypothetical protein
MTFAIAALLAVTVTTPPSNPAMKTDATRVTARINRAGEARHKTLSHHPPQRVRKMVERAPGGREQTVIVFDFE